MHKERFLTKRKSNLDACSDGPFQIITKINDNAYKVDLPGEYGVYATFNVRDLSSFDFESDSYLRTNTFDGRGNDTNAIPYAQESVGSDLEQVLDMEDFLGPITKSWVKCLKEQL